MVAFMRDQSFQFLLIMILFNLAVFQQVSETIRWVSRHKERVFYIMV
jgi:hypothetical protein